MRLIAHLVRERHANDFRANIIRALVNELEVLLAIDWVRRCQCALVCAHLGFSVGHEVVASGEAPGG
jgi:hypothetical protein